jgi:hypothetical protein
VLLAAKVCRPGLSSLTTLTMCCVRTLIHFSELTMYCLDCSDSPPFLFLSPLHQRSSLSPFLPLSVASKVSCSPHRSPPRRRRSPSPPRPPALPVAAKIRRPPRRRPPCCRCFPSQPRSAVLPVAAAATPRRHQGPPPEVHLVIHSP